MLLTDISGRTIRAFQRIAPICLVFLFACNDNTQEETRPIPAAIIERLAAAREQCTNEFLNHPDVEEAKRIFKEFESELAAGITTAPAIVIPVTTGTDFRLSAEELTLEFPEGEFVLDVNLESGMSPIVHNEEVIVSVEGHSVSTVESLIRQSDKSELESTTVRRCISEDLEIDSRQIPHKTGDINSPVYFSTKLTAKDAGGVLEISIADAGDPTAVTICTDDNCAGSFKSSRDQVLSAFRQIGFGELPTPEDQVPEGYPDLVLSRQLRP